MAAPEKLWIPATDRRQGVFEDLRAPDRDAQLCAPAAGQQGRQGGQAEGGTHPLRQLLTEAALFWPLHTYLRPLGTEVRADHHCDEIPL
ncbi:hypothetical protein C9424_00255 [Arthrobacter sp. H-02-3]|nr:hypothetical protein C9424_00255 [Arthrobacter sp. H-02-3]